MIHLLHSNWQFALLERRLAGAEDYDAGPRLSGKLPVAA
jgi:hypothetical protein